MKKLVTLSFAALLLSSTAVLAQSQSFDALDSDGDDKLSFSDLRPAWPDLTQEAFDAADIDGDDFLDLTQFDALSASMGSASSTEVAAVGRVSPVVEGPAFESLDSDGDGKLDFSSVSTLPGATMEIFDAADMDDDDFLDPTQYEAFKNGLVNPDMPMDVAGSANPSTLPAFESIDSDGDDKIAFSDLTGVLPNITQDQFDAADMDGDDFLDITQYQALEM